MRRRRNIRRARRVRHVNRFTYGARRPIGLQGFWRAPRYVGSAYPVYQPPVVVEPYIEPAPYVVPAQPMYTTPTYVPAAPVPATTSAPIPATREQVAQQYTRVKFYNSEMMGFTLEGAVVNDVVPGGPADDGGVEEGYMAFALNGVQRKPGTLLEGISSVEKPYTIDFGFVPEGFEARWSDATGQFFFANHQTKTTSWDLPPITMSKTAINDQQSVPTGRGDRGVFTVTCIVTFYSFDTRQAPIVDDVDKPGTFSVKIPKTMNVEGFIQLVEDAQAEAMAHVNYQIDYTSAYSQKGKLAYNELMSNVIENGDSVEVCGHTIYREGEVGGCCTIL